MLEHGGRLREAAKRYNIPLSEWLDLSTGINPNGWPVPVLPASIWSRLPEDEDGLEQAARTYYGVAHLLPVAGSQAAIQALPQLRRVSRVSVLHPAYAEHAQAWQRAGHTVMATREDQLNDAVCQSDVLVLVHPNNPTGARFDIEQLLNWQEQLAARGGWLVVDETFMDITPEQSLCRIVPRKGLIVLRSLGKFFGLAGARIGFVWAQSYLLEQLNDLLGPWTVNTPARCVAINALNDQNWQRGARLRLNHNSDRLYALLAQYDLTPAGGSALFQWSLTSCAEQLHEMLAQHGILTRLFTDPSSLRFGLPENESDWQRLEKALVSVIQADCPGVGI